MRLTRCDLMDCSLLGSSVHRFPRQEFWSGLPFPSADFPDPGIKSASPALAGGFLTAEPFVYTYISSVLDFLPFEVTVEQRILCGCYSFGPSSRCQVS